MNAEAGMGMSLDDMIKQNRKANKKKSPAASKTKAKTAAKAGKKKKAKGTSGGATAMTGVKTVTIKKKVTKNKQGKIISSKAQIVGKSKSGNKAANKVDYGMKLFVSNLDFGVTNKDLRELFGECGPLKSFNIHFKEGGKSQGTADVIFKHRADALKAIRQYNGRTLDGRVMDIQGLDITPPAPQVMQRLGGAKTNPKKRGGRKAKNAMDTN